MNHSPLFPLTALCCTLAACTNSLSINENTTQVLMGGSSEELFSAFGDAQSINGSATDGRISWGTSYITRSSYTKPGYSSTYTHRDKKHGTTYEETVWTPPETVVEERENHFTLVADVNGGQTQRLNYTANIDMPQRVWLQANDAILRWNQACAYDDLELFAALIQQHPELRSSDKLYQAGAQAARYRSPKIFAFLLNHYALDMNRSFSTWSYSAGRDTDLILVNTTLHQMITPDFMNEVHNQMETP